MSQQHEMSGPCFVPGPLLLPKQGFCVEQWACPASDQFANQPELWREMESMKQGKLTLQNILLPDAFLFKVETSRRVARAAQAMKQLALQELAQPVEGYIYLERTLPDGTMRQGLVGLVDLEQYSFEDGAATAIRSPIPLAPQQVLPRLELREQAILESSHIMLAADDEENHLFGQLAAKKNELKPAYRGKLPYGGGFVEGWQICEPDLLARIAQIMTGWQDGQRFAQRWHTDKQPLALVPIAGNADLAAAKAHWMMCKEELAENQWQTHPARFCLAELCNLWDEGVRLAPVHRVVMGVQGMPLLAAFRQWCAQHQVTIHQQPTDQCVRFVYGSWQQDIWLQSSRWPLAAGIMDAFLQQYLQWNPMCSVDYIAATEEVRELAVDGTTGLLLPCFDKKDIIRGMADGGFLPRSPFVMDATEHRYELECRAICTL